MELEVSKTIQRKLGSVRQIPGKAAWLPPWLFGHQDLMHALENAQKVSKDSMINLLNHVHFINGSVFLLLRDTRFGESILLKAFPDPCLGHTLYCRWADPDSMDAGYEHFSVLYLVIDDGLCMNLVPAELREIDKDGITLQLPAAGYAVGQRTSRRYTCHGIDAELIQSGFLAKGKLIEFSPMGFRLRLKAEPSCSFRWFNLGEPFTVHLNHRGQMLFSGACLHVRSKGLFGEAEVVVRPTQEVFRRYKNKHIRNTRLKLVPSPTLSFVHPFLQKKVHLQVENISSSGFSVRERAEDRVLIPGMMIPEMVINFAGALEIKCSAQVIYQTKDQESYRCGLAILDMDIQAYSRLTHILTNAIDSHAYVSNEVDMDALWEFFFTTGFIYPKKYRLIQSHRDEFRKTYEKLYMENPEVARHFTYQNNGRIFGHISMVRAYERAWMIHHHAAHSMESRRTGFMVLKQIMHYLNDMHRLPSANMDYVMSYFRPDNAFPDRVFGGFARELNNPKGCSTDHFCYLPYTALSVGKQLPDDWALVESTPSHLWEFGRVYEHFSGGLLLEALGLNRGATHQPLDEHLRKLYEKLGLQRSWQVYSLMCKGILKAVLICNHSDLGFNLSELLNGIKILVTDPEGLPWDVLSIAISSLGARYRTDKIPVLSYPVEYVKRRGIPYEKLYQLWILNVQYGNEYLEYMQRKFRISYK